MSECVGIKRACEITGFGKQLITLAIKRGELQSYRKGKRNLVLFVSDIQNWLDLIKCGKSALVKKISSQKANLNQQNNFKDFKAKFGAKYGISN